MNFASVSLLSSIHSLGLLAQMRLDPNSPPAPAPGQPGHSALNASAPPVPEIRDIVPPVDVFPYPMWMVATAAALAMILIAVVAWLLMRWWRNRPPPIPLSARAIALRELEVLRTRQQQLEPYAFSFDVSDVLRRFVGGHYGLQATRQTSPEFLATLSSLAQFTDDDRQLLAGFLEKCDLIKFARQEASHGDSEQLLGSAVAFVKGARA